MSRLKKIGNESKKLQIANRDMEKRLNEIKALFEKEQGRLIWLRDLNQKFTDISSEEGEGGPYLGK